MTLTHPTLVRCYFQRGEAVLEPGVVIHCMAGLDDVAEALGFPNLNQLGQAAKARGDYPVLEGVLPAGFVV